MFTESPHRNLQAGLNLQTATVQSTELCTLYSAQYSTAKCTVLLDVESSITGNKLFHDVILLSIEKNILLSSQSTYMS